MARLLPTAWLNEDGGRTLLESGAIMASENEGGASGRSLPEAPRLLFENGNLMTKEAADGGILVEGMTPEASELGDFENGLKMPTAISRGARGGPTFRTTYQEMRDGTAIRVVHWSRAPVSWDVARDDMEAPDSAAILNFYRATRGTLRGFRFQDPIDWSTHPVHHGTPDHTDKTHRVVMGYWDQSQPGPYQLIKRYTAGTLQRIRPITRPMLPADPEHQVEVYVDGVLLVEGTDYAISYDGGAINILAAGSAYDQGAEVEWAGTFDVPARFSVELDENLRAAFQTETIQAIGSLPIVELSELTLFSDHPYPGGTFAHTMDANSRDFQIDLAAGMFQEITPDVTGRIVYLPTTDHLGSGGPFLYVMNGAAGGSGKNLVVKDVAGTTTVVTALAPQEIVELDLVATALDAIPTWGAFG